jgi:transcriptional regulator with XRE-family HTH domain
MAKLTISTEEGMRPSAVFAQRLRETRGARDLSQSELVTRMGEIGRPLGKASLVRVEKGTREPTLDEAIGLAAALWAAPANLLSPPAEGMLALTANMAIDSDGLRNWLLTGFPLRRWPDSPREEDRPAFRRWLEEVVVAHAGALADAARVNDKAGITAAAEAIIAAVRQYQEALEAL